MKTEIVPFNYKDNVVRTVQDETGEIFWVAKDICEALGYKGTEVALRKLDSDEKLMRKIYASGQSRNMMCINESGLYNLILRSTKPEAKKFKKWVTSEVLPSIRKTGSYSSDANLISNLTSNIERLLKENDKLKEQINQIEMTPSKEQKLIRQLKVQEQFYRDFAQYATKYTDEIEEYIKKAGWDFLKGALQIKVEYNEKKDIDIFR